MSDTRRTSSPDIPSVLRGMVADSEAESPSGEQLASRAKQALDEMQIALTHRPNDLLLLGDLADKLLVQVEGIVRTETDAVETVGELARQHLECLNVVFIVKAKRDAAQIRDLMADMHITLDKYVHEHAAAPQIEDLSQTASEKVG
ncbi:hypothetical protein BD626DRAFT_541154 [Schizophyllum amplum]|uniref:Uncharacterized protein n=1 Tax=Schizophyllum amplum TaxID=97359 RepID=A0A550BVU6_9AGAR|nr:hypothetical protein BD626DRAFT_541154 [Auriculariopsis ampla]